MIKMILTDGDGTLWEYRNLPFMSSWDALADSFSSELREKWFSARDSFFQKKESSYNEWFKEQLAMLKGLSLEAVEKFLFPIPYSVGARDFFANLSRNYKKGIVSAGINLVADKAKDELGMDFAFSNILNVDNGKFTGEGELVLDLGSKEDLVRRIAKLNRVRLSEICFVGDNSNDLPALEIVGKPLVFDPKDKSVSDFPKIRNFSELNQILKKNEY